MGAAAMVSVDEFQALEQKVLRAVELIKQEREARAAAEARVASLKEEHEATLTEVSELRARLADAGEAHKEVETLNREREAVKQRVEKMLAQMDELL